MQLFVSTAQVTTEPLTQVLPAPVQLPGGAGQAHAAPGAVPWQVCRPGHGVSELQVKQPPTETQVSIPVVPHFWSPAAQALRHPPSVAVPPSRALPPSPPWPAPA
jgi:hypothetical protein